MYPSPHHWLTVLQLILCLLQQALKYQVCLLEEYLAAVFPPAASARKHAKQHLKLWQQVHAVGVSAAVVEGVAGGRGGFQAQL